MYSHTKKVGSGGRYGPRIGRKIREEVRKIEDAAKKPGNCPRCGRSRVKRIASGIWECKPCRIRFSGGAYMISAKKNIVVEE